MEMNLSNLISPELIKLELESNQKKDILAEMVGILHDAGKVLDKDIYLKSVIDREALGSTGIGMGIAIPHGKSDVITDVVVAFGRSSKGVDFEALDDNPVNLVFLLAAPKNVGGVYLKALAQLSRLLRKKDFRDDLLAATNQEDVMKILTRGDASQVAGSTAV